MTTHWLPKRRAQVATRSGSSTAAVLTATLSAPARSTSRISSAERTPPPTRERHEDLAGGALDDVEQRAPALGCGGDVEEADLVGAGLRVAPGQLGRIALVGEVDEADALDDPAVLDVEAGDDTSQQHQALTSDGGRVGRRR